MRHIATKLTALVGMLLAASCTGTGRLRRDGPAALAHRFVDAVNAGDRDCLAMFDFEEFADRRRDEIGQCSSDRIRQYFDELLSLPVRHPAPLVAGRVERSEYRLSEEIRAQVYATVLFHRESNGQEPVQYVFELTRRRGQWVIFDMRGWFESYAIEACRHPSPSHESGNDRRE